MNKPRIGIDVDGVLRDIYSELFKILVKRYPEKTIPPVNEWKQYEIWKALNLNQKELSDIWFKEEAAIIYRGAKPYTKTIEFIKQTFPQEENDYIIVTAQPNIRCIEYTINWLDKYFNSFSEFHSIGKKYLVPCDVYIEDSPLQTAELLKHSKQVMIIERPWNLKFIKESKRSLFTINLGEKL